MKHHQIALWLIVCCFVACTRETDEPSNTDQPTAQWSPIDDPLFGSTSTLNLAVWDDRLHILAKTSVGSSTLNGAFEQKNHLSDLPDYQMPFNQNFFLSPFFQINQLYLRPSPNPNMAYTSALLNVSTLGQEANLPSFLMHKAAANAQCALLALHDNGYSYRKAALLKPKISQNGNVLVIQEVEARLIDLPNLGAIGSIHDMGDRFLVAYDTPDGRLITALVFPDGTVETVLENEWIIRIIPLGDRWLGINRSTNSANPNHDLFESKDKGRTWVKLGAAAALGLPAFTEWVTDYDQAGETTYFADQLNVYSVRMGPDGQLMQKKAPQTGIVDKKINAIALWNNQLFAATLKGVYRLSLENQEKDWE